MNIVYVEHFTRVPFRRHWDEVMNISFYDLVLTISVWNDYFAIHFQLTLQYIISTQGDEYASEKQIPIVGDLLYDR